jgi:hypothetical protein
MRLAVDPDRGFRVGCVDEAEDLAGALVDPVAQVVDAMAILGLEIGEVGLGHIACLDSAIDDV